MPTYIKTGFWEKTSKRLKGYLNLDDIISDVISTNVIKKVYTAFITQTGTDAPVATVLKDDLNSPVWEYSAVGTYTLTKIGAFTLNKTVPTKIDVYTDDDGNYITLERTNVNVMTLKTYAAADTTTLADGVLNGQYVNIEVYI